MGAERARVRDLDRTRRGLAWGVQEAASLSATHGADLTIGQPRAYLSPSMRHGIRDIDPEKWTEDERTLVESVRTQSWSPCREAVHHNSPSSSFSRTGRVVLLQRSGHKVTAPAAQTRTHLVFAREQGRFTSKGLLWMGKGQLGRHPGFLACDYQRLRVWSSGPRDMLGQRGPTGRACPGTVCVPQGEQLVGDDCGLQPHPPGVSTSGGGSWL
eukprot:82969-Rhodomonas_salina.2